jgi:hypothetical protein
VYSTVRYENELSDVQTVKATARGLILSAFICPYHSRKTDTEIDTKLTGDDKIRTRIYVIYYDTEIIAAG